MSDFDAEKWDSKYREGAFANRPHPSQLVETWAPQILASLSDQKGRTIRALDIACGRGRNAFYLASLGFAVTGIDISSVGLEQARHIASTLNHDIEFIQHDLENGLPSDECLADYDLIIIMRYVNLRLLTELAKRLRPGGTIICEEHLQISEAESEKVTGPKNPKFRVAPGALLAALPNLTIVHEFEGRLTDPDGEPSMLAQIVAQR